MRSAQSGFGAVKLRLTYYQCFAVRSVGLASYLPAVKLTDRRKKAFLAEFSRHGILVRAARAASPLASAPRPRRDERGPAPGLRDDSGHARGRVSNAGLTHMGRKRWYVHGEPMPTETRPCLQCRKPFESEGSHHRLCGPCTNRASETSPYAV